MKEEENIWREVDKTLRSLDDWTTAKTDDFFYARLQHRMDDQGLFDSRDTGWFAVAAAAVIFLVLANIFTLREFQQSSASEEVSPEVGVEALAREYQVEVPLIYELNAQE